MFIILSIIQKFHNGFGHNFVFFFFVCLGFCTPTFCCFWIIFYMRRFLVFNCMSINWFIMIKNPPSPYRPYRCGIPDDGHCFYAYHYTHLPHLPTCGNTLACGQNIIIIKSTTYVKWFVQCPMECHCRYGVH